MFYKSLNTINKYLDNSEKYESKYTTFNKINAKELVYSNTLLDMLYELVDNYADNSVNTESFIRNVDDDFPGWSKLVNTIGRFHDMFYIIN